MDNRLLKLRLQDTLPALADLLMPRVCLACGRTLTLRERIMCLPCSMDLPLTRFELWEHNPMADRYNEQISMAYNPYPVSDQNLPSNGVKNPSPQYEPYQRAAALIYYRAESGYSEIPRALKYRRNFAAGRHFAAMLGRRLAMSPLFKDVDLVVPVPLHWTRRLRRGYNQADVIAREVARVLGAARQAEGGGAVQSSQEGRTETDGTARASSRNGETETGRGAAGAVAFEPRLLRRARRTKTQTHLSGEDKHQNVAGAFELCAGVRGGVRGGVHTLGQNGVGMCKKGLKRAYPQQKNGGYAAAGVPPFQHILLIDDVFTSGSTLAACHSALRTVFGPEVRISVATLAFTG